MLDFWILQPDENVEMVEGCFEGEFSRPADFQIGIEAFYLALDNGLVNVADEFGLSYFEDALLSHESCNKIRDILMVMDIKHSRLSTPPKFLACKAFSQLPLMLVNQ